MHAMSLRKCPCGIFYGLLPAKMLSKPLTCTLSLSRKLSLLERAILTSSFSTKTLSNPLSSKSKFLVHFHKQITKHGRNGNIQESEFIFNRIPCKDAVSYTAMLTAYADNGQVAKARKLFDGMPQRSTASYNAMITAYMRNNCMVDEAFALFSQMVERNAVSYAAMITGFFHAGMVDKAEELYRSMPAVWQGDGVCSNAMISGYLKVGRLGDAARVFEGMVERDVVSWSSLVNGYCKEGKILEARGLFDRMQERNVVTWTAMINGYMNAGRFEDGFGLFLNMRREGVVAVNTTTLTVMFGACSNFERYREGMEIHGLVLHLGFKYDVFLSNSIINMYSRFGFLNEAKRIFQGMSEKNVVSWNTLIAGYIQHDEIEEAYKLFEKMPRKDVVSWTSMITGFSTIGNVEKSIQLFRMMPERDDIAWTALVSGFVSNGKCEEAFHCFIEMLRTTTRPNPITFSSMLSACAGLAMLNSGLQIHCLVVKMNLDSDLSIQNSLISMYTKCGNVAEAYQIFRNIDSPNIISFNSIITGFAQNGLGKEALDLFSEMENESWKPNDVTFLGVLSACAHVGLVEKGRMYFNLMRSVYGVEPRPDHYACMVDLLGRAGFLQEAIDLIHSMPVEPHSGVWGALLGASRTHLHLDLAKLAVQHINKLEPDNATPYVVLSDLYNVLGKKKDGDEVRMTKNSKGIKKSPGCSWVVLKDKVHLFLSGDKSHTEYEEISLTLGTIANEMNGLDSHV